jgi:hypothetical protein
VLGWSIIAFDNKMDYHCCRARMTAKKAATREESGRTVEFGILLRVFCHLAIFCVSCACSHFNVLDCALFPLGARQ